MARRSCKGGVCKVTPVKAAQAQLKQAPPKVVPASNPVPSTSAAASTTSSTSQGEKMPFLPFLAANPWVIPAIMSGASIAASGLSAGGQYLANKIREGRKKREAEAPMRRYEEALKKYEKDLAKAKKKGRPLPQKPVAPTPEEIKQAQDQSPAYLSDEDVKVFSTLPEQEQNLLHQMIMSQNPESFFGEASPQVDLSGVQQAAQQPFANAQELGFPAQQPGFIENLMQQTDFGPISDLARREFRETTVPGILNQLTGLGQGGRSSAFAGALGKAGEGLDAQLAALRSKYGLQRAQTLGNLGLKQQAIDLNRANAVNQLGMNRQQQQFGQQQALAGLGLQQNAQNMAQQQSNQNALLNLLGLMRGQPIQNTSPSLTQSLFGAGLGLGGTAMNMYNNQQQTQQLGNVLGQLNAIDKGMK